MKAHGLGSPTGTTIVCCTLVVFFITYLYFKGAASLRTVRRRAAWALMHLPWLLVVILLLEGELLWLDRLGVKLTRVC